MYKLAEHEAWCLTVITEGNNLLCYDFCFHSQRDVYIYSVGVYAMCHFRFQGVYYAEAHAKCARFLTYPAPLWTSGPFYWVATALLCWGL